MSSSKFSDGFKRDAVAQMTERGDPVRKVSERLGVSPYWLCAWQKKGAKPSSGEAEKAIEIRCLKTEPARVSEERDIPKRARLVRHWSEDNAEHRGQFSVRAMCRCLHVQPSGFHAWWKAPLSKRAWEDARQTELLTEAWVESGKVHAYRKLHGDRLEQGEEVCLNRVARLTRAAGITVQIGDKRC